MSIINGSVSVDGESIQEVSFLNIVRGGQTSLKLESGESGELVRLILNRLPRDVKVILYDGPDEQSTKVGMILLTADLAAPVSIEYGIPFSKAFTFVISDSDMIDITVVYK